MEVTCSTISSDKKATPPERRAVLGLTLRHYLDAAFGARQSSRFEGLVPDPERGEEVPRGSETARTTRRQY